MRASTTSDLAAAARRAATASAAVRVRHVRRARARGGFALALACTCAVASGCDDVARDTAGRELAASERTAVDPPTEPATTSARPFQRGPVIGGQLVPRAVQWPAAAQVDLSARSSLPAAALSRLAAAPAPVLAPASHAQPRETAAWTALELHTGPAWWSLVTTREDLRAVISASTAARLHAGLAGEVALARPNTRVRGGPATSSINEGIRVLTWFERGAALSAELECPSPDHTACADDRALRELVEGLALVGGGPLERELAVPNPAGADE